MGNGDMATPIDSASDHTLRSFYQSLVLGRCVAVMPGEPYTGEPLSPLLPPIVLPPPRSLLPIYAVIALGTLLIGGLLVLAISLIRPTPADNTTLISTALTGIGLVALQVLNFIKSSQAVTVATQTTEQVGVLHKSVNSGFEEFARLIRAEARAEGVKEEQTKQIDLNAIEARIAAAVDAAVARTLMAAPQSAPIPPVAPVNVTVAAAPDAVAVEEVKPQAAQAIADAVRPPPADQNTGR